VVHQTKDFFESSFIMSRR